MLDDLRREVGERSRMLLAARVGVGYFNRLIARRFLRARMAQTSFAIREQQLQLNELEAQASFFRFIWPLLFRNTRVQHHQIHRTNRYNNNILLHTNHIRRHSDTTVTVGTKRILQVADHLRISFRIGNC